MNPIQIVMFVIVTCCTGLNQAGLLPDYIKPCKGTDPNLNECATLAAKEVIPELVKGYPPLNIPVLSPLKIEQIKIDNKGALSIDIKDALVYGLDKATADDIDIKFQSQTIGLKLNIPSLNIQGEYQMSGQLLVLPLSGKGPCNITIADGVYTIEVSYSLYDKDGAKYAKVENVDVGLDIKGAHFDFANLLNSNQKISDDVNAVLNKEWRQIIKDLEPAIKDAVVLIVRSVVNNIVDKIPFAEIFDNELP